MTETPSFTPSHDRQVEIPVTSKERYITGYYALSLPSDDGSTVGDWHDAFFLAPLEQNNDRVITLGGQGSFDTNDIFGNYGVADRRKSLIHLGLIVPPGEVFVANHVRGLVDLIHYSLVEQGSIIDSGEADVMLDNDEQLSIAIGLARRMLMHINPEAQEVLKDWITDQEGYSG